MPTYTDWPDGKKHSIPYAQHLINMRNKAGNPMTLPPPPVGTYDPAIDYNASASQRGYNQTVNDGQTLFERGQQDYGLDLGDLTQGRDYALQDISTSRSNLMADYERDRDNLSRQFGILGRQQRERSAAQGITSQGLLRQSAKVRGANESREQNQLQNMRDRGLNALNTSETRVNRSYDQGKTRLDLANAREFGGFGGNTIYNPLTGQPEFGNLFTNVARAGAENTAYQSAAAGQRSQQAAARGYVSPLTKPQPGAMYIGGTPVTPQMWQSGLLLEAMLGRKP